MKKAGTQRVNNARPPPPPQSFAKSGYLKTVPITAPKELVVIDTDTLNDQDNDGYGWNSILNALGDLITTFSELSQAEVDGIQIDLDALSKSVSAGGVDKPVDIAGIDMNKNEIPQEGKAPVMITKEEELKGLEIARKELEEEGGLRGGTKVVIYGTLLIVMMLGLMKFMKAIQKFKRKEKRNYYDEERTGMIGIAI